MELTKEYFDNAIAGLITKEYFEQELEQKLLAQTNELKVFVGDQIDELARMTQDGFVDVMERLDDHGIKITGLDDRMGVMEIRMGGLEGHMGGLEKRMGGLEGRMGNIETALHVNIK